jgi:tetratricopeptide (TPR) repeat protein
MYVDANTMAPLDSLGVILQAIKHRVFGELSQRIFREALRGSHVEAVVGAGEGGPVEANMTVIGIGGPSVLPEPSMRHLSVFVALCLALPAVVVAPVAALADSADEPAVCAVESKLPPGEVIGICGLVIGSNTTSATRVHALVTRAELHRKMEHYDLAMADCEEAIRLDPANAEAFDLRGNVLASDKKFERALDDFDRSIRLDPKFARAFSDRAVTFGLMHEPRLAVRDYTEAVRLDPNNVQAHVDRAEAYVKVRRADLAIDDYGEAIRLDPSSPDHYDSRGSLYARNNAYDRAIADFNEAIRLLPKASYFLNRGNANNLKGDPDRAIADYDEALRLEPELAMAYNNRGVAWRDKGDRQRALADFSAAVRLDPDLAIALEHRKRMEQDIASASARSAKPPVPFHASAVPVAVK